MNITGFLRGIKGATTIQPSQFMAANKVIRCGHCESQTFFATRASFHTATQSWLNLEWLAKEVHVLVCAACTRLEQFYDAPEAIEVR